MKPMGLAQIQAVTLIVTKAYVKQKKEREDGIKRASTLPTSEVPKLDKGNWRAVRRTHSLNYYPGRPDQMEFHSNIFYAIWTLETTMGSTLHLMKGSSHACITQEQSSTQIMQVFTLSS